MIPNHGEKKPWENLCVELRKTKSYPDCGPDWDKLPCECFGLRMAYEQGHEDGRSEAIEWITKRLAVLEDVWGDGTSEIAMGAQAAIRDLQHRLEKYTDQEEKQ